MSNIISDQLRPVLQSVLSGNRNWVPNHVYAGVVQEILGNGSIAVLINNKVYQAITHIPVHSGDLLNLRLLGTTPEPHFAITGLATIAPEAQAAVAVQSSSLPTIAMFAKLNSGIEGLANTLLQHPEQLARISSQLQPLLAAIAGNTLATADLARPGKLKDHVLASGFFHDSHEAAGIDGADIDLKGLLLQLLGLMNNRRTLALLNGRPGFIDNRPGPGLPNSATSLAQYTAQDDNSLARDLKNIITQNAESTLLQIVSSQLAARDKSTDTDRSFVMNLMIEHGEIFVPLQLELNQRISSDTEFWEASFSIELPKSGRMEWTITVKNPSVRVALGSNREDTRQHMSGQMSFLRQLLELQDLKLDQFSCIATEDF